MAGLWDEIKVTKQIAKTVEEDAGKFIEHWAKRRSVLVPIPSNCLLLKEADTIYQYRFRQSTRQTTNMPLFTCTYFVSDPPGSHLLNPSYSVSEHNDLKFILDSYQLATDKIRKFFHAPSAFISSSTANTTVHL